MTQCPLASISPVLFAAVECDPFTSNSRLNTPPTERVRLFELPFFYFRSPYLFSLIQRLVASVGRA